MRKMARAASLALLVGCIVPVPGAAMATGGGAMPYDFNGDGYADLAVGVPGEGIGSAENAGAVQVLYGSATGATAHDQLWHQDRAGIKGAAEADDGFGTAIASGDFDRDGFADLAVGIPGEDLSGSEDTGAVQVLYGSAAGLTARDQLWHQDRTGVIGHNEDWDRFGWSVAAGDFTGDGHDDLAIGVYGERRVAVLRGSALGLTAAGDQNLKRTGGRAIVAGDVNGDGVGDVAITEMFDAPVAVHLYLGGTSGLVPSQAITTSALSPSDFDELQVASTALGDFNADGRDDLAIGLERDELDTPMGEAVSVLYAQADGLHPESAQVWSLDDPILPGSGAIADTFGAAVAAGDLSGDNVSDLAVGVPGQPPAGAALVLLGGPRGLTPTPLALTRAAAGVSEANDSTGDQFASSLTVVALSGMNWLAVGAPGDDLGSVRDAGSVTVFPQSAGGPVASSGQMWHQDSPGIKGAAEIADTFGQLG